MKGTLIQSPPRHRSPSPRTSPGLPDHISPTAAKSYLSCSLRFFFERVARIPKPTGPALHLGKAIHAALQRFHLALWRGEDHSPGTIADAFGELFTTMEKDEGPVSWKDDAAREKAREAGLRVVAAYLDSPEVLSEPPRAVEVLLKERIEGLSVPPSKSAWSIFGTSNPSGCGGRTSRFIIGKTAGRLRVCPSFWKVLQA